MKRIVFRADAKPSLGTGDLASLVNLSKYFDRAGWGTYFIAKGHKAATGLLERHGVKNALLLDEGVAINDEIEQINDYLKMSRADAIMFEITERPLTEYSGITDKVIRTCVNFDGVIPDKTSLVINWDVDADNLFDIKKHRSTRFLLGPQYAVLPISFDFKRIDNRAYKSKPEILLIAMGGADELDFTQKIADAVTARDASLKLRIVVGSGYQYLDRLKKGLKDERCDIKIMQNIDKMFEEFMGCDIAIGAGGLTAFELMATRTPSLIMATYEHQIARCLYFDKMGWATYLGFRTFDKARLSKALEGNSRVPPRNIFKTEEIRKAVDELLERR